MKERGGWDDLLVRHEDLPAADDGCEGDRLVILPVPHSLSRVDEDDEVVALALVVDLALGFVSARHGGWVGGDVSWDGRGSVVVDWWIRLERISDCLQEEDVLYYWEVCVERNKR